MTEQGPPPQSPWTAPDERPTAVSPHAAASVAAFPYAAPSQPHAAAFPAGPSPLPYAAPSQPHAAAFPYAGPSPQPYAAPSQPYLAPNSYGAPPYPPASGWPVAVFRSVRGLAVAVVGLAVAWTALDVLVALTAPSAVGVAEMTWSSGSSTPQLTSYDVVTLLRLPVMVGAWIVASLWLMGVRANAALADRRPHARGDAWVWLGWIVPVVWFWFPYQVVRDAIGTTLWGARRQPGPGPALPAWWASWLVMLVASRCVASVPSPDGRLTQTSAWFEIVVAFASVVACGLWIRLVWTTTVVQDELVSHGVMPDTHHHVSEQQAVSYLPGSRRW